MRQRRKETEAKEYAARWEPDYEQVRTHRDKLAEEYRETYSKLEAQLVDLFGRTETVDNEVGRINARRLTASIVDRAEWS